MIIIMKKINARIDNGSSYHSGDIRELDEELNHLIRKWRGGINERH